MSLGQKQSTEQLLEFGAAKGLPSCGTAKGLPMEEASHKVFLDGELFPLDCVSVSWSKAQMRPKSRVRVRVRIGRNGRNVL